MSVPPSRLAEGRGQFCSKQCQALARAVPGRPSTAICQLCGDTFSTAGRRPDVTPRYCSQRCYGLAQRQTRGGQQLECQICQKPIWVAPSDVELGRGKYCSRSCYYRSRAAQTYRCEVCGKEKPAHRWQRRRYCSLTCSNRGRALHRARPAPLTVRNRRIEELHRKGLKAPDILEQLPNQSPQWREYVDTITRLTPAGVRQVIARECDHCARRRGSGRRI